MPTSYVICEKVRGTPCPNGAVLLDVEAGRLFSLNRVGSRIFELLKSGVSSDRDLIAAIGQEFGIGGQRAQGGVLAFLNALEEHGLVRSCPLQPPD